MDSTASKMSKSVISSSGRVILMPPVPRATLMSPAFWSWDIVLRMMTGLTLTLPARKSLVSLYWSPNASMQAKMWTAMVKRLEICICFPLFHEFKYLSSFHYISGEM